MIAILFGCGKHPSPKETAITEEPPKEPDLEFISSTLALTAMTNEGETIWKLFANEADAKIGEEGSYGNLKGVNVLLFRDNQEIISIQSQRGWANQFLKQFNLEGDVSAITKDKRIRLNANRVSGSAEEGTLTASDQVRAFFDGMSMGLASIVNARFQGSNNTNRTTNDEDVRLEYLTFQGSDVWFTDRAKNMQISNVRSGEMRSLQDGEKFSIKAEGSPIKAEWKREGLYVECSNLDSILLPQTGAATDSYKLHTANFKGGVTIKIDPDKPKNPNAPSKYVITIKSSNAVYEETSSTLKLTGGVTVTSTHSSLVGNMRASTATVHLKKGTYEPDYLIAEGSNITYVDDSSGLNVSGLIWMKIGPEQNGKTRTLEGRGSPMRAVIKDKEFELTAQYIQATILSEEGSGTAEERLLAANFSGGVTSKLSGEIKTSTGALRKWSLSVKCPEMKYEKSTSSLTLLGGVTIEGDHPILGAGGGTAFAPRARVEFKKGTFEPQSVRMERDNAKAAS